MGINWVRESVREQIDSQGKKAQSRKGCDLDHRPGSSRDEECEGGTVPSYNVQVVTDTKHGLVVNVEATTDAIGCARAQGGI